MHTPNGSGGVPPPQPKPPRVIPLLLWYQGYTLDESDEQVRRKFEHEYGRPPQEIFRDRACIKAGPVILPGAIAVTTSLAFAGLN